MKILSHPHRALLSLFALAAFASCKVSEDEVLVVTAPPEYSVDLYEQRSAADGTPTFGLWLESMALYEGPGYGVDATIEMQNGDIEVKILGVTKPSPCTGAAAPAKQFLSIGNLADGTYGFHISLRDVIVNKGTLKVTNGRYQLSLPDVQGLVIENYLLEPLPAGTVWGYAATPNESSQPVSDNFLSELKALTTESGLAPGFYGYFTVSGTNNITFHKSIASDEAAKYFVRRLSATPDALKALLQNYRTAAQPPLDIKCWTTEGEF